MNVLCCQSCATKVTIIHCLKTFVNFTCQGVNKQGCATYVQALLRGTLFVTQVLLLIMA